MITLKVVYRPKPVERTQTDSLTAVVAGWLAHRVSLLISLNGSRWADLKALLLVSMTWAAGVAVGLWLLRSDLPSQLRRRKATSYPHVAERQAAETSAGIEP